MQAVYTYRMLDRLYEAHRMTYRSPSQALLQQYLAYRVSNEPSDGNERLTSIRRAAMQIVEEDDSHEPDSNTSETCIRLMCSVLVEFSDEPELFDGRNTYIRFRKMFNHEMRFNFDNIVLSAALCMNRFSVLQRVGIKNMEWPRLNDNNVPFPSPKSLAGTYCDERILGLLMTTPEGRVNRQIRGALLHQTSKAGRLAAVQFVYHFRQSDASWEFNKESNNNTINERNVLAMCLNTPNAEVLEFIMNIITTHCVLIENLVDDLSASLRRNARLGNLEMVRCLLSHGARSEGQHEWHEPYIRNYPIIEACSGGLDNIAVIDLLLKNGASPDVTIAAAASRGHTSLVRELLDRNFSPVQALAGAAKGPYLDIVRLLLDAGVDVNESTGADSPLVSAISLEHTELFKLLVEKGADLQAPGIVDTCISIARRDGLESMLELLGEYGIDVTKSPILPLKEIRSPLEIVKAF